MKVCYASGVAALIQQRYPDITVGALKSKLGSTADALGPKPFYGKGYINAANAVQ